MLKEAIQRRESTPEIIDLERREYELWLRYKDLDRYCQMLSNGQGSKDEIKKARKRTVAAHRLHQKCVHKILNIQKWRLFRESKSNVQE